MHFIRNRELMEAFPLLKLSSSFLDTDKPLKIGMVNFYPILINLQKKERAINSHLILVGDSYIEEIRKRNFYFKLIQVRSMNFSNRVNWAIKDASF